jgi:hypothetical protein
MLAGALAATQRLQPFGVDMPVAAFFVVSPMLFVWSVSDRISDLGPSCIGAAVRGFRHNRLNEQTGQG